MWRSAATTRPEGWCCSWECREFLGSLWQKTAPIIESKNTDLKNDPCSESTWCKHEGWTFVTQTENVFWLEWSVVLLVSLSDGFQFLSPWFRITSIPSIWVSCHFEALPITVELPTTFSSHFFLSLSSLCGKVWRRWKEETGSDYMCPQ